MATGTVYITTTDADGFLPITAPPTQNFGSSELTYVYSTQSSINLSNDADLNTHLAVASAGPPFKFFPAAGGSAVGCLDFAPNPEQEEGFWHRTQTLDYIIMLKGELELTVEGGDKKVLKAGDIVVQRAPMHKWKNLSRTEGARYVAVTIGVQGAVEGHMEFNR